MKRIVTRTDLRPAMPGKVLPLADKIAALLREELADVDPETAACACLTLAHRIRQGAKSNGRLRSAGAG